MSEDPIILKVQCDIGARSGFGCGGCSSALGEHQNLVRLAAGEDFSLPTWPLDFNSPVGSVVAQTDVHTRVVLREVAGSGLNLTGNPAIDWVGQFRALVRDGYRRVVSLETHWRGAGSAEASTAQSWAGMKGALQKAAAL